MNGIFISYRRDDSSGYAGRLYDRLVAVFGADRVFMDVEDIELGTDFIVAIERALDSSIVFIALIGKAWTHAADATGRRRLDDPQDFIRLETKMAIERKLRIVPVLIDDADMPRTDELPPEIADLARRQAIEINHRQWESSTGALIQALKHIVDPAAPVMPPVSPLKTNDTAHAATHEFTSDTTQDSDDGNTRHLRRKIVLAAGLLIIAVIGGLIYFGQQRSTAIAPSPASPMPEMIEETAPGDAKVETKTSVANTIASPPASPPKESSPPATAAPATPTKPARDTTAKVTPIAPATTPKEDAREAAPVTKTTEATPPAPQAGKPATASAAKGLPTVGDRWTYRSHSKWRTNPDLTFQFAVTATDGDSVTLSLSQMGDEETQTLKRQRINGSQPAIIEWPRFGMEFSPFIAAFSKPDTDTVWRNLPGFEAHGFVGDWYGKGKVTGRERVRVPAGEFDAIKVEVDCNRHSSGSRAEVTVEPIWMHFELWYAPQVKRYVKLTRRVVTVNRSEADKDTLELIDYRLAQ